MSHLRVSAEELVGWRFSPSLAYDARPPYNKRTTGTALWGFLGL